MKTIKQVDSITKVEKSVQPDAYEYCYTIEECSGICKVSIEEIERRLTERRYKFLLDKNAAGETLIPHYLLLDWNIQDNPDSYERYLERGEEDGSFFCKKIADSVIRGHVESEELSIQFDLRYICDELSESMKVNKEKVNTMTKEEILESGDTQLIRTYINKLENELVDKDDVIDDLTTEIEDQKLLPSADTSTFQATILDLQQQLEAKQDIIDEQASTIKIQAEQIKDQADEIELLQDQLDSQQEPESESDMLLADYGQGRNKTYSALRKVGVLPTKGSVPYQNFVKHGYFRLAAEYTATGNLTIKTYITLKGQKHFEQLV